ncbi:hypothetical protein GZL_09277 [Streptomyces sp. 769]|nr:hypothetical protein GZL_09277 [Streptomyces sp. 769]
MPPCSARRCGRLRRWRWRIRPNIAINTVRARVTCHVAGGSLGQQAERLGPPSKRLDRLRTVCPGDPVEDEEQRLSSRSGGADERQWAATSMSSTSVALPEA